jgi:hypothetical protein
MRSLGSRCRPAEAPMRLFGSSTRGGEAPGRPVASILVDENRRQGPSISSRKEQTAKKDDAKEMANAMGVQLRASRRVRSHDTPKSHIVRGMCNQLH